MRITSKGQVTIPQDIREAAGLLPGTDVEFRIVGRTVTIEKAGKHGARASRGAQVVARLKRSSTEFTMSTEEIMALMRGPSAEEELNAPRRLKRPHRRTPRS